MKCLATTAGVSARLVVASDWSCADAPETVQRRHSPQMGNPTRTMESFIGVLVLTLPANKKRSRRRRVPHRRRLTVIRVDNSSNIRNDDEYPDSAIGNKTSRHRNGLIDISLNLRIN